MFNVLSKDQIDWLVDGELGPNSLKIIDIINGYDNAKFIDIGVETGKSSMILLNNAIAKQNHVWGIDPIPNMGKEILDNPNYHYICGDSVESGKTWKNGKVDVVFFDSVHIKPQVMRELCYWWDLIKVGGWAIFHDTAWSYVDDNGNKQYYIHKHNHPCAGKKAGNLARGCDTYAGRDWPTPDEAIRQFFNINDLNTENDIFKSESFRESLGMTFIQKKADYDFSSKIKNWDIIEADRQTVLRCFQ